jgi:DNA-binding LacI/PurR family transcriptional regulator
VDEANSGLTHAYFSHVLDSFRTEAEREGYDITFICKRTGSMELSYYEHSRYRGVDGVVVACVDFDAEEVKELVGGDLPVVTIDYVFDNRTCIQSDNIQGMEALVSYIIERGHTRIAFIHGTDSSVAQNRLRSYFRTMERHGIHVSDEYVREGIYHAPEVSAQLTEELLALEERPTCIIYPDDFSCIGGINVIKNRGLSIPDDISVAGYDGQRIAMAISPRITTYRQNTEELGRMAAKKLIELIEHPKTSVVERIVVKGELIRGESVL